MKGDVVLFSYEERTVSKTYKLALVTRLEFDSDEIPRIAEISYSNAQEIDLPLVKSNPMEQRNSYRITRKGIHTLIKIYSADDTDINTDIDLLNAEIRRSNSFPPTNLEQPHQAHKEVTRNDNKESKKKSKLKGENHMQQNLFDPLVPNIPEPLRKAQLDYLTSTLSTLPQAI